MGASDGEAGAGEGEAGEGEGEGEGDEAGSAGWALPGAPPGWPQPRRSGVSCALGTGSAIQPSSWRTVTKYTSGLASA